MPSITLNFPQPILLKGLGDAEARHLEFIDHLIALIESQGEAIPASDGSPVTNEQDATQIAEGILHMAHRRDPDEEYGFFLVEEIYSILYGETSWKKRSTGNRIQIGKMFGKLVAGPDSVESIDGQFRKIVPAGKTPQNQAKYRTVVTQMLDELQ